jgi:4-hydroxyphenylacetate 3-monooxygenase
MTMADVAVDPGRLGISKVVEVLSTGDEPHLLTGEQYKQSLRDGRRIVDSQGQEIEDVTAHPDLRAVNVLGRVLDQQFDSATRDSVTYEDPSDGRRRAVGWQVPTERDHLWAKRETTRLTTMETLGMFGRPPDYGPMMALGFLATIDRIEAESHEFAQNIRDYVRMSGDYNLLSTDLIVDPQSDRRIPRSEKPGQLRIVEDRADGIVLRGAKVAGSIGALAHYYTLSTVLGEGVGEDAAIWCAVPINSKGLSLVMREPTARNGNEHDHPLDSLGEEMDQIILFNDVFIPRELVFSARNLNLLDLYYESCAYALWSIMMRLAFRAEIFAGVAQAITEILGTNKIPGVQAAVAEVTLYAQTLKAYSIATIMESVEWSGVQVPSPPLVTAGRLYSIQNYPRINYLIQDLSGQALISRWPEKVWDHPEFGPLLDQYLPGTGVSAREKNRFFNFVWDLLTGAHAGRVALFENVNATPPAYVAHLVYEHTDRSEMARLVRKHAGIAMENYT